MLLEFVCLQTFESYPFTSLLMSTYLLYNLLRLFLTFLSKCKIYQEKLSFKLNGYKN